MWITEVRLENIKSYAEEQRVELRKGINALIGENGAGKSTVVEAIGAALFGEVPYRPYEEFVRRGARSGRVVVCFISDRDGREYQAVRQFGRGATWYIYDEETGFRLAEGERATTEWLRDHLQCDAEIALREYWENIGPPQGTLTAPFLGNARERNSRFLPLLRVEGFERAFQDLLPAKQALERQRAELREEMARMRTRLERRDQLQAERDEALRTALEAERQLLLLRAELAEAAERLAAFDQAARLLQDQQTQVQLQRERLERAKHGAEQAAAALAEAQRALEEREALAEEYGRYRALGEQLRALEARREQRARLEKDYSACERERDLARQALTETETKLSEANQAFEAMRQLAQRLPDRAEVGAARTASEVEQRFARALEQAKHSLDEAAQAQRALREARDLVRVELPRLEQVQDRLAEVKAQIEVCEAERPLAERLEELEADAERARQAHADARAALDLARNAREQLSTGLCPILFEDCQNVARKSGGNLAAYFREQLRASEQAVESAWQVLERAQRKLEQARAAAKAIARLSDLQASIENLAQQQHDLSERIAQARRAIAAHASADEQFAEARRRYDELAEHARSANRLAAVADRRGEYRSALESQRAALQAAEQRLAAAAAALQPFSGLDDELRALHDAQEVARQAYERYLALDLVVASLPEREQALARAREQLAAEERRLAEASAELERHRAAYDAAAHDQAREHERALSGRVAYFQSQAELTRRQAAAAAQELESLEQVERDLAAREREERELQEVVLLTEHLRQALRQAGPEIVRALLAHVSEAASRAFVDIMGDNTLELEWRTDFEIVLRQNGVERSFRQLSGGEQMAAALAVRMALQQLLGRQGLLILDEPTTNMDDVRRAQLAQQIEALKGYQQVILVSHSDEFDGMFGHIVHLSKRDGQSRVGADLAREPHHAGLPTEA